VPRTEAARAARPTARGTPWPARGSAGRAAGEAGRAREDGVEPRGELGLGQGAFPVLVGVLEELPDAGDQFLLRHLAVLVAVEGGQERPGQEVARPEAPGRAEAPGPEAAPPASGPLLLEELAGHLALLLVEPAVA